MSAEEPGSITRWLEGLKAGRPEAVEAIWRRYYDRVLAVARRRLAAGPAPGGRGRRGRGLECPARAGRGGGAGSVRTPRRPLGPLADPGRHHREEGHRPATVVRPLEALGPAGLRRPATAVRPRSTSTRPASLARAVSKEPVPELVGDPPRAARAAPRRPSPIPILRQIAEWRMEGASNAEIARRLGRAVRTVERKLELIRLIWEKMIEAPDERSLGPRSAATRRSGRSGDGPRRGSGKRPADVAWAPMAR